MAIHIALGSAGHMIGGTYQIRKTGAQGTVDIANLVCAAEIMSESFDEFYLNVKVGQKNTQYPFVFERGNLGTGVASVDISKSIPGFACSVLISMTLISEKYQYNPSAEYPPKTEVIETNSLEYILPDRFAETYARKDEVYDKEHTYSKGEVYSKEETYSKDEVYSKDEAYSKDEVYSKDECYSKEEVYTKEEINSTIGDVETLLSNV